MNLLTALKRIRDNGPVSLSTGICYNLKSLFREGHEWEPVDHHDYTEALSEFSEILQSVFHLNPDAPVEHPDFRCPVEAYDQTWNKWEGEYGDNRRALLNRVIAYLENNGHPEPSSADVNQAANPGSVDSVR